MLDQAEQKGTGRWTVQTALDLGMPVSGIAEAVFARSLSGDVVRREAAAGVLPGPSEAKVDVDRDAFIEDVRHALYASKVVAYAQGFDEIRAASERVRLEHRPRRDGDDLARRLHHPGAVPGPDHGGVRPRTRTCRRCWSTTTSRTRSRAGRRPGAGWSRPRPTVGVPAPGFSSSLAYYDGLRAERLPAALIQGLRDFFGAHTYRRVDREGTFHLEWSGDRTETQS